MKIFFHYIVMASAFLFLVFGCQSANSNVLDYPANFREYADTAKVNYLIKNLPPDSVAHIIVRHSLPVEEKTEQEFHINSINEAVSHAYGQYRGDERKEFGTALNNYTDSLPDRQKYTLYYYSSKTSPYRLGYKLAKEWGEDYQKGISKIEDLKNRLILIKDIVKSDKNYYHKFEKGFKTGWESLDLDDKLFH